MSAQLKKIKFDRRGRHVLGTKLGEGAQGFIYSLKKENGEDSEWCAKITAIAKATKSRQSASEANERALQYERLLYQSTFARLQGEIIPRLPKPSGDTKTLEAYKNDAEGAWKEALKVLCRFFVVLSHILSKLGIFSLSWNAWR
jgi:hypothetical protein